jgi:hypothetical protein
VAKKRTFFVKMRFFAWIEAVVEGGYSNFAVKIDVDRDGK